MSWLSSGEAIWQRDSFPSRPEGISVVGYPVELTNSVRFLPHIAFCSTVIWKGVFVNHLPFYFFPFRDPVFNPLHFPHLKLLIFVVTGFVLTFLLSLYYLLPKVFLHYFEDLKYWEGKYCFTFLFLSDSQQNLHVAIQRYSTRSERSLARTAEKKSIIIPRSSAGMYFVLYKLGSITCLTSSKYSELWHYKNVQ